MPDLSNTNWADDETDDDFSDLDVPRTTPDGFTSVTKPLKGQKPVASQLRRGNKRSNKKPDVTSDNRFVFSESSESESEEEEELETEDIKIAEVEKKATALDSVKTVSGINSSKGQQDTDNKKDEEEDIDALLKDMGLANNSKGKSSTKSAGDNSDEKKPVKKTAVEVAAEAALAGLGEIQPKAGKSQKRKKKGKKKAKDAGAKNDAAEATPSQNDNLSAREQIKLRQKKKAGSSSSAKMKESEKEAKERLQKMKAKSKKDKSKFNEVPSHLLN